jgi:UPF0042 nucleotide-binding protein
VKRKDTRRARQIVLLTGLSGSGKGSVLKTFEDLGYYCVDNLPVNLIPIFGELCAEGSGEIERAALLVDAREGGNLGRLPEFYRKLRRDHSATLVFVEASDDAIQRRFSETRRPHPMGRHLPVREAIRRERRLMASIRKLADVLIDTTKFTVHELRNFIVERFQKRSSQPMLVSLLSFGYKHGVPNDADMIFDVRFLPNPHFVPSLRRFTGQHPRVARYIHSFRQTGEFLRRIESLLLFLLPQYVREGKSYFTVGFGCTGGQHRSVMMAEALRRPLEKRGYLVKVSHRDIEHPAA